MIRILETEFVRGEISQKFDAVHRALDPRNLLLAVIENIWFRERAKICEVLHSQDVQHISRWVLNARYLAVTLRVNSLNPASDNNGTFFSLPVAHFKCFVVLCLMPLSEYLC